MPEAELAVTTALATVGLLVTLVGTLREVPGCVHWHGKSGRDSGTLELTLAPGVPPVLSFAVHANRTGAWTDGTINAIASELVADSVVAQLDRASGGISDSVV